MGAAASLMARGRVLSGCAPPHRRHGEWVGTPDRPCLDRVGVSLRKLRLHTPCRDRKRRREHLARRQAVSALPHGVLAVGDEDRIPNAWARRLLAPLPLPAPPAEPAHEQHRGQHHRTTDRNTCNGAGANRTAASSARRRVDRVGHSSSTSARRQRGRGRSRATSTTLQRGAARDLN